MANTKRFVSIAGYTGLVYLYLPTFSRNNTIQTKRTFIPTKNIP